MAPGKITFNILIGVATGFTIAATWAVLRYLKKRANQRRPVYMAEKISIVSTPKEWEALYLQLKKDLTTIKVLGLDCEWVEKRKVALLQLASPSGQCVLVQLFKLQPPFPDSLRLLLEDTSILKVGVAVADDGRRLYHDYGLKLGGCVDLRNVLKRCKGNFKCPSRGLRGLAKGILGMDISKDVSIRCGNWEAEVYSQNQVDYAATDAAVAVDIFLTLVLTKMELRGNSSQTCNTGNHISVLSSQTKTLGSHLTNYENLLSLQCQKMLSGNVELCMPKQLSSYDDNNPDKDSFDVGSSLPQEEKEAAHEDILHTSNGIITDNSVSSILERTQLISSRNVLYKSNRPLPSNMYDCLHEHEKEQIWKCARSICQGIVDSGIVFQAKDNSWRILPKRVEKNNAYSCRKRPLWDNCRLEAPDGSLLCTCDLKKAHWYLEKELGDTVCEDPLTVRLRFEPSSRPESDRNYYLQDKENVCVVCGCDRDYVRKFVVPCEYRRYFPKKLKDHSSHDVLLLCTPCHRTSCEFDAVLRSQLAEECRAPVDSGTTCKTFLDHDLQKVRSAGRALKVKNHSIPEERVAELENIIKDYYGVDQVTDELLELAATIDARQSSENYIPHGKLVVQYMTHNGGLLALQTRWRQHFLDTMNPKHLPAFWSVDFVPESWTRILSM